MEVGRDAYAVFVAGSSPAGGDLYAVRTQGGPAVPITFTNVGEMRPRLSPDGGAVVFLRGRSLTDSTPASVWVMNLLSGAERELVLPKGAGKPAAAAWSDGGRTIVVSAGALYVFAAPPANATPHAVEPSRRAEAESSLAVVVGHPAFATVLPCADPKDLCVQTDTGTPGLLASGARDAFAWGRDSVAYFIGNAVEIRPLGPGRGRELELDASHPRQMTAFTGLPTR